MPQHFSQSDDPQFLREYLFLIQPTYNHIEEALEIKRVIFQLRMTPSARCVMSMAFTEVSPGATDQLRSRKKAGMITKNISNLVLAFHIG